MPREARFTRRLVIVMDPKEYDRLQKKFSSSTCRVFSEFIRDILCHRPIPIRYRNDAADEWLLIALDLKSELDSVVLDLTAALRQLPGATGASNTSLEQYLSSLKEKVEEIKLIMHQIYQRCT